MEFALCIAEPYYVEGICRVEYFSTLQALEKFRMGLDQGVTCWIMGEAVPKRKVRT